MGVQHSAPSQRLERYNTYNLVPATNLRRGSGLIVPVDEAEEAEDAEEESSSGPFSERGLSEGRGRSSSSSGSSLPLESSASDSGIEPGGRGGSKGRPASLALAKERWRLLMMGRDGVVQAIGRFEFERER